MENHGYSGLSNVICGSRGRGHKPDHNLSSGAR